MTDEGMLLRKLKYPPAMSMALNKDHLYSMMADIMKEAADRIEELVKEVDRRIEPEQVESMIKLAEPIMAELYGDECSYREEAEAKLEKAVEALRFTDDGANAGVMTSTYGESALRSILRGIRERARYVLAELEETE